MENETDKKSKSAQLMFIVATLFTSLVFTIFCLFIMVLYYHDYQTARDWIVIGGPLPTDVFVLGGIVFILSMSFGFYIGAVIWSPIFAKFGTKIDS